MPAGALSTTDSASCLLIDADRWDDADWLGELVAITTAELPAPKPKAPRKPKVQKPA